MKDRSDDPVESSYGTQSKSYPSIRVGEPWLNDEARALVIDAMNKGEIGHFGPRVHEFEECFSAFCGAAYGIATSSGTAALHVALTAMGVGPGDEVIVPTLTMIATVNAVTYTGAHPVLVDCQPDTWTLDPCRFEAKITARTRVVLPVHLYGHPCDMDAINRVAAQHDVAVLEDAAQAHGAEYRGRRTGSLGHVAAFSFYLNKLVTTGEGGMVVTDDKDVAERARRLRNQAFDPVHRFIHSELGFNYRMTNVQAAIGVGQMRRITEIIEKKRQIASWYRRLLQGAPGVTLPSEASWARSVLWMFTLIVEDDFGMSRDELIRALGNRGVETRAFFVPVHRQPLYRRHYQNEPYPVAERLSRQGLYLPSSTGLTRADTEAVVEAVFDAQAKGR